MNDYKSTIYHELGHCVGYILANKRYDTHLGKIAMELGVERNRVMLEESYYRDLDKVQESTKNIPRTIAWFIEVILGSLFQANYQKRNFKEIFAYHTDGGGTDLSNLLITRGKSSFNWHPNHIDDREGLQGDLNNLFPREFLIAAFDNIVDRINNEIVTHPKRQIDYSEERMDMLCEEISEHLDQRLFNQYTIIIDKWNSYFSARIKS